MGSYVSLLNDTDDVIMVKLTANTRILAPIIAGVVAIAGGVATVLTGGLAGGVALSGTTLTYAAIGAAGTTISTVIANSITNSVLADFEAKMISGYEREGFAKVFPGHKWRGPKQTLGLNQRMWLVRFDGNGKTMKLRTADSSVWTGNTADSDRTYRANNYDYFQFKLVDEYNVEIKQRGGALTQRGGAIDHQTKRGGNSLMTGVVTGLLLASPFKSAGFGWGTNSKRGLSSQGPASRPLALGARPRSNFEAKISDLLK